MTDYFTTSDGLRLAFDDRGAGHPMLCLAGLTRNMTDFEAVAAWLADPGAPRARVIRMDYRGRGLSDRDPEWSNYNLVREGQDALELLDHLGLARASILGTSRGGLISMVLAATQPERLAGAILNDIGPVLMPQGLEAIMSYLGRPPVWRSYDEAALGLAETMAAAFPTVSRAAWRAHAERIFSEGEGGLALRYDPRLRDAMLAMAAPGGAAGEAPDLWPLFDALAQKPLALIRGAHSDLLSAETAAEMRRRAPDMLYAEVPDRGHVPFLDEPEARAVIDSYLGRVA